MIDRLPLEIQRLVICYLSPKDLAILQLVSRSLHAAARDSVVWRKICYLAEEERVMKVRRRFGNYAENSKRHLSEYTTSKAAIRWDPSDPEEEIDWYAEYIARHGPVNISWLQSPAVEDLVGRRRPLEAKGVGVLKNRSYGAEDQVIELLENGLVTIWDASRRENTAQSRRSVLSFPGRSSSADLSGVKRYDITVDSISRRAYIADANVVNEVDLSTLELISQRTYPEQILALSEETPDYQAPITVATRQGLHLFDPRLQSAYQQMDTSFSLESHSWTDPTSGDTSTMKYIELLQPGPNCVLHPPPPSTNSIIVAGRFSSILLYDRRNLGRLQASVHSGARLCGLAALPSIPKAHRSSDPGLRGESFVACGEHRGTGSVEIYSHTSPDTDGASAFTINTVNINRVITSPSKLLSVALHGSRLVFSDSIGRLIWMERDGMMPLRILGLNGKSRQVEPFKERSGINLYIEEDSEYSRIACKIIPTGGSRLDQDGLIIWTGSQIGRVHFSHADKEEPSEQEVERMRIETRAWQVFRKSMSMRLN
ncbi:F-box domain-containing protein [Trichophyton interdigitale]|uniref:F-box domain-containing protein n=1 Tax=Trichophyton interdigitale TaxID=101480 RepID=A0A9P4YG88_9EURO|nr:F-box domain-containing protein [Trichophyton interdigitale]KAF3899958.1 F-box domain-containing protein [Trichophyton interdigitale]KAG8209109.1 F-box domain-containing protein [Trichophyton interdigitale]